MTPYEQIKAEVVKCCPEIMELKFGCEYRLKKGGTVFKVRKDSLEENYCGQCREGQLNGQAFRNYRCGYCKKGFSHPNTGTPRYCVGCAKSNNKCRYCACYLEILGSPIELHHILRTIDKVDNSYSISCFGTFEKWKIADNPSKFRLVDNSIRYNLTLPVALQSEETLKGLSELLTGNTK